MWKLFITVIAMSDTGAVSTNVAISDYNSRDDCFVTAKGISGIIDKTANGHSFRIITNAQCNGDGLSIRPPEMIRIPRMPGW